MLNIKILLYDIEYQLSNFYIGKQIFEDIDGVEYSDFYAKPDNIKEVLHKCKLLIDNFNCQFYSYSIEECIKDIK